MCVSGLLIGVVARWVDFGDLGIIFPAILGRSEPFSKREINQNLYVLILEKDHKYQIIQHTLALEISILKAFIHGFDKMI
jgi:hypothetical protein